MADNPYDGSLTALEPEKEERTWGMLCHLASCAGYLIPFGHIIGPLVVWQIKKDGSEFVDHHGKESLNFQITFTIAMLVSVLLIFVVVGIFFLMALPVIDLIFVVIASIKANNGEWYRYPISLRLIK